jgi:aldehyde:ferredoxin oxidoreductase
MEIKGYAGKALNVDLTEGTVSSEPLDMDMARNYVGGMGIGNRLAMDLIPQGVDPFSPHNPIILTTGVFNGTAAPGAPKIMGTCKMPANNVIGTGFAGGSFGHKLKFAGYDYIVIRGKADKPVYLKIEDDRVQICAADHIWGHDVYSSTYKLREETGEDSSVIAIGPSAEKLIRYALAFVDNLGTLGRGGLGAVMGSKKLKGITVRGAGGVEVAEPAEFNRLAGEIRGALMNLPYRDDWVKLGIYIGWPMWKKTTMIVKNWAEICPEDEVEKFGPQEYLKYFKCPAACASCPVADKAVVEIEEEGVRKEYALSYGLHSGIVGVQWGAKDYEQSLRQFLRANKEGVDDMMLNAMMDYAIELYKKGILTRQDTDGLDLDYNYETYAELSEKIYAREGIGDLLAEGYPAVYDKLGPEAQKHAVQIRNLNVMVEPRPHLSGFIFAQITSPRGSYAIQGNSPAFLPGKSSDSFVRFLKGMGADDKQAARVVDDPSGINMGRMLRYTEDWYALASSLGICARQPVFQVYNIETVARLYTLATGLEKDPGGFIRDGERIWNVYRQVNARHGFSGKDDKLPSKFFTPLKVGEGKEVHLMDYTRQRRLSPEDINGYIRDYYQERGWDEETGNPAGEKLKELGIDK